MWSCPLIDNSDPLHVSSINRSDIANIYSEFHPLYRGTFDMSLCSNVDNIISNGDSPNSLPKSNLKNVTIRRVGHKVNKAGPEASTIKDELPCHEWKWTAENPPTNAGIIPGEAPEIKPVTQFSFKPTEEVKTIDDAEYSDKIDTWWWDTSNSSC